jgi:hypothetical protein
LMLCLLMCAKAALASPQEVEQAIFESDTNRDGQISKHELTKFLEKSWGKAELKKNAKLKKVTQDHVDTYWSLFDKDKDGFATLEELLSAEHKMTTQHSDTHLRRMFTFADGNRDGKLDQAEYLTIDLPRLHPDRKGYWGVLAEDILERLDLDKNGKISLDERLSPLAHDIQQSGMSKEHGDVHLAYGTQTFQKHDHGKT